METERYIISIGKPFGRSPGMVEVSSCNVDENGDRDAFQNDRIALSWATIRDDGTHDDAVIESEVMNATQSVGRES